jgi:endonuclease/exonuclease/phosphatase (EEP) superfamily protein YafD
MQPLILSAWLKSIKIPTSTLFPILLFCLISSSCAFIPQQEQFVTSANDSSLVRNNGDCYTSSLYHDIGATASPLPGLSPHNISILNWNIYKEQRQNWDADFIQLSHKKDLVFLQEASLSIELQQILHQNNMYWNLNSAFKYKGVETGVLIASTIKPLKSCGLRHSEPIIRIPKTILISRYIITDSPDQLLVASIHGINISFGTGAYQEQFNSLYDILKHHDGPIILAGDFNNWSKKRAAIIMHLAETLSLQTLNFNNDDRTTFFGNPVDHILYRGLEPITQKVHQVLSSDHKPISVTFRLSQEHDTIKPNSP